jgi:hypothetical protein
MIVIFYIFVYYDDIYFQASCVIFNGAIHRTTGRVDMGGLSMSIRSKSAGSLRQKQKSL